MSNQAVVVFTTKYWEAYKTNWDVRPNSNLHLFGDTEFGDIECDHDKFVKYNKEDLIHSLNLQIREVPRHYWNGGNRTINWFYPHLRMCYFYLMNPQYERYWFFDDDVKFQNGSVYEFVEEVNKDFDFSCTFIFGKDEKYLKIDDKMASFHTEDYNWLSHFPGEGDTFPEGVKNFYGSFFPIVCLSKEAIKKLIYFTLQGYIGYSEGWVPTVLSYENFIGKSIYNKDGNSDLFDVNKYDILHKNIKMTWDWI